MLCEICRARIQPGERVEKGSQLYPSQILDVCNQCAGSFAESPALVINFIINHKNKGMHPYQRSAIMGTISRLSDRLVAIESVKK